MPENQVSGPVARDDALSVEHQDDISIIRIQDPQLLQYLKGLEMLSKAIDSVRLQHSKVVVIHNAPSAYAPENLDAFWNQVDAETSNRADYHLVKRMRQSYYSLDKSLSECLKEFGPGLIGPK
jgi:hypothetical protein